MKGLDTNFLVRYITKDDLTQWQIVSDYLDTAYTNGDLCLINNIVLCELVWVLRSAYKFPKLDIVSTLEKIAVSDIFVFEDEPTFQAAIEQFKQGSADFSDYLIGQTNQNAGCSETATFDRKLNQASAFQLL
ncbi:MAG: type II toxin-antitoxin system VapC family toxin [Thermosynechococcaceae cyanobacterium]